MYGFFRRFLRFLQMVVACIINKQTGLLLVLIGSFWTIGVVFAYCYLGENHFFQWAFWHLFDLSEVRATLESDAFWLTKIVAGVLYLFTWVLGCGVLISILIDEKLAWTKQYNLGKIPAICTTLKNHVVILGWDEMACSLINELINGESEKVRKVIIVSRQSAEDIRKQLFHYQIDTDSTKASIEPWNGEYDSPEILNRIQINTAKEIYVLGNQDEVGHDYRVLAFLDSLIPVLATPQKNRESILSCYALIHNYSLYWDMIRQERSDAAQKVLHIIPINYYENWCKHLWGMQLNETSYHYEHLCRDFNTDKDVALVIAGFSIMGQTMLIEALRIAHYTNNRKTHVLIIDPQAECLWKGFLARHPKCTEIPDIVFGQSINDVVSSKASLDMLSVLKEKYQLTVALTYRDTDSALADAIFLEHQFGKDFTLLVREDMSIANIANKNKVFSALYSWGNIFFFGKRCDSAYNPWHRELLAKRFHDDYLSKLQAKIKRSQTDWEILEEQYRWKYRYQIDALPEIFYSAGFEIAKIPPNEKGALYTFSLEDLQVLSVCSHNRWWADRLLEGWTLGDVYDKEKKLSPNMKEYKNLPKKSQDIDFQFIEKIPACLMEIHYQLKKIK